MTGAICLVPTTRSYCSRAASVRNGKPLRACARCLWGLRMLAVKNSTYRQLASSPRPAINARTRLGGRRSAAISVWVRSPGLNLGLVQDGPRPWLRSTSASWGARRSRSADRTSIDRGFDACCALVHIHPPALDVTTHHVDFAVGWIAISRAQIVECGNSPVTVLIFALSRGENLFAGSILEVIDVRLIDIELQKQLAGLRSCFHHHRNPLPLRPPIIEPRRSQLVDPFRQIVSVVFGQALAFVSCRQAGIKERTGDTAAYFSRNAVEDIEQPVENRQRILREEQLLAANHPALARQSQDRGLI